jgi:multimeric flavodoxin WrbA
MKILIIGMSLDPDSKSQKLARVDLDIAHQAGHEAELIDLPDITLPLAGEKTRLMMSKW